jgi:uncharacterized cupin superfamily protein
MITTKELAEISAVFEEFKGDFEVKFHWHHNNDEWECVLWGGRDGNMYFGHSDSLIEAVREAVTEARRYDG